MNERAQFGYHPDADQIGAFVEQALPEHEREQVLGHLAVCAECRAIVALSLPEIEPPAIALPKAARRPWWSGWALAWPIAGAVAALAFLIFYMHSATPGPSLSPPQQIAVARPPAAPNAQEQTLASPANPELQSSKFRARDKSFAAATGGVAGAASPKVLAGKPAYAADEATVTGRDTATLSQLGQTFSPQQSGNYRQSDGPSAASQNQMSQSTNNALPDLGSGAAGNTEGGLQLKTPTSTLGKVNEPAPTAPVPATQPANSTSVSVEASDAAPAETISADAASVEIAQEPVETTLINHRLPSRLAVLSMAVQGRFVVAIDTRSAVFMSNDAGKHWKAIASPWQGRAMKAALVVPPGQRAPNMAFASGGAFQGIRGAAAPSAIASRPAQSPAPPASGSSITGRVTDPSGAVVAGANIVVTEIATGTAHRVRTDGTGRYLVDGLAPGTYGVEAQAIGFNAQRLAAIAAAPNGQTVANLSLTVSATSQTVTVTGADVTQATDAKKKAARPAAPSQAAPIFEITTDNGERWTSTDGVAWTRM